MFLSLKCSNHGERPIDCDSFDSSFTASDIAPRSFLHVLTTRCDALHPRSLIFCLGIQYALFEELVANDMDRAAQVYAAALALVPHATFTFGKLWLLR
jgi:hypothetical protein